MADPAERPSAAAVTTVTPEPSLEEAAAIAAALSVAMAPGAAGSQVPAEMPRWRFSGRWWTKPVPQRRDRP